MNCFDICRKEGKEIQGWLIKMKRKIMKNGEKRSCDVGRKG